HVKIEDLYLAVNRGQIRNGEKALLESQLSCQIRAKFTRFLNLANRFGAAWRPIREGECAHAEASVEHLGISRDRALTAAPHSRKKSPLRRDALLCLKMFEVLADRGCRFVAISHLDPQRALTDAWQHHLRFQDRD